MTELQKAEIAPKGRKLEFERREVVLTPLELILTGNSIEIKGEILGADELFKRGREFLLKPFGLTPDNTPQIAKERKRAYIDRSLYLLLDSTTSGYTHRLRLPELQENGQINPRFIIQLLKYNQGSGQYELILSETDQDRRALEDLEVARDYCEKGLFLCGPYSPASEMSAGYVELGFDPELRARFDEDRRPHFAPIEHLMFGSTPSIKDQDLDVDSLIALAKKGDKKALGQLLTPVFIQSEGEKGRSLVLGERQYERKMKRAGTMIIDLNLQVALAKKGVEIYIELSDVDKKTGLITPSWKVFVIKQDGEVVSDEKEKESVKLLSRPDHLFDPEKLFSLQSVEGEEYLELSLNLSPKE